IPHRRYRGTFLRRYLQSLIQGHSLDPVVAAEVGSTARRGDTSRAQEHTTMRVIITAVARDHWGLADPVVHYVTSVGAHIAEIQMYDHDEGDLYALLIRLKWPGTPATLADLRAGMAAIAPKNAASIRVWARDEHDRPSRLAICTTYRLEPAVAVLE